ncbi:MAG: carbon-nitrogen hydrolase family protein [Sulfurovum sp.]|nr:carbon-nitrogen hydrolase family protein [Sulfurovum sp.]MCB4744152.1 carbon-nitrogen hydrolase family protein [Sulfurovum sp.]MCB4746367.1 carbon-nitrogen hydrolase family protein [Sulfurovum sp.]MCB4747641.1 carbon-nitrogen hydrolase family protein [Sulfurovum sp.]MCB4748797.1 carbon-nitrogen hydrolase family protein [Sulfurovum sp.]
MLYRRKPMRVATFQLSSHKRYQTNLDRLFEYIRTHCEQEIIVVPEVFLTTYDYEHLATAAKFSAMALKLLKKEIDTQILVITLLIEEEELYYNQAVVIHKHKVVHRQEKVKLFKLGDEDLYLAEGKKKRIKPFEIDGIKYALLICFELRFKDLWKQIEGADVVLVPARWGLPRKQHLEILSRALAVMNQCYVIVSNSADNDMASSSAIISPNGNIIMNDKNEVIEGIVDFKEIKKIRRYIVMN